MSLFYVQNCSFLICNGNHLTGFYVGRESVERLRLSGLIDKVLVTEISTVFLVLVFPNVFFNEYFHDC